MKEVDIPRYIDDPLQVMFWEIDEIAIVFACMGIGIMFEILFPLLVGSLAALYFFQRFKYNKMNGILLHMCYWMGVLKLNKYHETGLIRRYTS